MAAPNSQPLPTPAKTMQLTLQRGPLPEGSYTVELVEIGEEEGPYGLYLRWHFRIAEGPYKGRKASIITGADLATHTGKLYRLLTGMLGRRPRVGEPLETDDLEG